VNKSELIDKIAALSELTKKDSEKALNALIEGLMQTLGAGEDVVLPGFGTWKVKMRAERTGRNPQTGVEMKIPAKKVASFSAGKKLKEAVEAG